MNKIAYTITEEKELGKSEKEFVVDVGAEVLMSFRDKELARLVAEAELPGFRKGKAPAAKVLEKVGEMHLLEEAAEKIVNDVAVSLIAERKLRFIGRPTISIKTLAALNPLRFSMTVTFLPEVTLPDYKKIAAEINGKQDAEAEVTDAELNESLERIKKMIAQEKKQESGKDAPYELTDESVKELGGFKNLDEFKQKLKADLLQDKQNKEKEKRMLSIIDTLVTKIDAPLPDMLVEQELDDMESEFSHNLTHMGTNMKDYLARIKKTPEDMRKDWRPSAEKRAKFELIFPKIAKAENLTVPPADIERELKHLMEHQPDAEKETASLYIERVLMRREVLRFLAEQKA